MKYIKVTAYNGKHNHQNHEQYFRFQNKYATEEKIKDVIDSYFSVNFGKNTFAFYSYMFVDKKEVNNAPSYKKHCSIW